MINVHHQFSNMKTFLWNSDIWIKAVYLLKRNIISNMYTDSNYKNGKLIVWCNSNILCLTIWIDYWFTLNVFSSCLPCNIWFQYLYQIGNQFETVMYDCEKKLDWVFHLNFFLYHMLKLENKTDAVFQVPSYFGVHLWRARRKSPIA